ncbi:MAG: hypothetical protein VX465_11975 [Pseudomonadota bacterium]|nr:hypothetical protein [Pseudomonadota bacterium]
MDTERVSPQPGAFLLRRELERGLKGGETLRVIREWDGRFEREPDKLWARGEQVSCIVEAPAILEPVVAIERARVSPGPFPAQLDTQGRIVGRELAARGSSAREAVRTALAMLTAAGKSGEQIAEARRDLARIVASSASLLETVPPDLFYPTPGKAHDRRQLDLPGGLEGEVFVSVEATARRNGMLECLERKIVTQIGEDIRPSRECWTLEPA